MYLGSAPPMSMKLFDKTYPTATAEERAAHKELIAIHNARDARLKAEARSARVSFIAFLLTFGVVAATILFVWLCWLYGILVVLGAVVLALILGAFFGLVICSVLRWLYRAIRKKVDAKID